MIVLYKNATVEKQYSSLYADEWRYPEQVKKKLHALNQYIACAESLRDLAKWPPFNFHLLIGKRSGEWSIRLGSTGYRVTVIPCDQQGKELIGEDIIAIAQSISIIKITEVSNHYE